MKGKSAATSVVFFVKRPLDGPVVWQAEASPSGVIETGLLGTWNIAFVKPPVLVEGEKSKRRPCAGSVGQATVRGC